MFAANIVLDSITEDGNRLTTMEWTFPKFILAQNNTHRQTSKNSASSRAMPSKKIIDKILENPVIPVQFAANKPGMQAGAPLVGKDYDKALSVWLNARDNAIKSAQELLELGVHKEVTNRLIEPFMWATIIISATDWMNLFALRTDAQAQPEFRKIAVMAAKAYLASAPQLVAPYEWHIPYIAEDELSLPHKTQLMVATARIARVSLLNHDGERDVEKDVKLHDRLLMPHGIKGEPGHMSPFEHTAQAMPDFRYGNFVGWKQYRKFIPNENITSFDLQAAIDAYESEVH